MTIVFAVITIALALLAVCVGRPTPRAPARLPVPGAEVREAIAAGHTVRAIRRYRQATGASLLEAAQVVRHHAG